MIPTACRLLIGSCLWLLASVSSHAEWITEKTVIPFDFSKLEPQVITPLEQTSKPWRLCALYPHLKDSYWLSVNYGMVDQAEQLGVNLKVLAADGYIANELQLQQLDICKQWQADAILLGSISYDLLKRWQGRQQNNIPVFGLVNNIAPDGVTGKVGVDWYQMGYKVGKALAEKHPKGFQPVKVAWFSSPTGRGGSDISYLGLQDGLADSAVTVVHKAYGDNDQIVKRDLIAQVLSQYPDIDYLIGGAVMAEIAVGELRRRNLTDKIKIISTYLSHGVYRGLLRNKIILANDDQMVLQGRLSIDQAVCFLEEDDWVQDLGPKINSLTPDSFKKAVDMTHTLSPAHWRPVYEVIQKTSSVNK